MSAPVEGRRERRGDDPIPELIRVDVMLGRTHQGEDTDSGEIDREMGKRIDRGIVRLENVRHRGEREAELLIVVRWTS